MTTIEQMASLGRLTYLGKRLYRFLLVVQELYRQQLWMYENHTPSVSLVKGFSFVEKIGWEAYNESCDLMEQIERYRQQFGFYPESVHVDQIYKTRKNRAYCQSNGIRLSGPMLGRPIEDAERLKKQRAMCRQDEIDRIPIEGKFGQGKRRFTLARIMAKLAITSETVIMVSFMVMNLEKILSRILFLCLFVVQDMLVKVLRDCLERVRWMPNSLPTAA